MNNNNVKIFASMIEDSAQKQIERISAHPAFIDAKIRIMPDVHAGTGCVCGFTADLGDKVVPNLIGVDIGCAVLTVCLGKIDIDYAKLDGIIREYIPSGKNVHKTPVNVEPFVDLTKLNIKFSKSELEYFDRSIGTLGSGNHFLEIDADDEGNKYLIIHTGSRNLGKKICEYWQNVAVSKLPSAELTDEDVNSIFS